MAVLNLAYLSYQLQDMEEDVVEVAVSAEELCDKMIEAFPTLTYDGLTGTGITWDSTGAVSKTPKGMVIKNGAYVGME